MRYCYAKPSYNIFYFGQVVREAFIENDGKQWPQFFPSQGRYGRGKHNLMSCIVVVLRVIGLDQTSSFWDEVFPRTSVGSATE